MGNLLFGLAGRIPRKTFWLASIALLLLSVAISSMSRIAAGLPFIPPQGQAVDVSKYIDVSNPAILAGMIAGYVIMYMMFAVAVKRMHDRNGSIWWIFVPFVIMIASNIFLMFNPQIFSISAQGQPADPKAFGIYMAFSAFGLIILIWWLVSLGCMRGTIGPNNFGEDPLQGIADQNADSGWAQ